MVDCIDFFLQVLTLTHTDCMRRKCYSKNYNKIFVIPDHVEIVIQYNRNYYIKCFTLKSNKNIILF